MSSILLSSLALGRSSHAVARVRQRNSFALLAVLPLSACTGAPAINVVGSFFPSWMLCGLIGIVSAVVFRQVLVLLDLESVLLLPLVTHALVAAAVTLAVWLLWFGH